MVDDKKDIVERLNKWLRGPGPMSLSEFSDLSTDLRDAVEEIEFLRLHASAVTRGESFADMAATRAEIKAMMPFFKRAAIDTLFNGGGKIINPELLPELAKAAHEAAERARWQPIEKTYKADKPCCTICGAQKRCHVCGDQTLLACSDCAINFGATIYVCRKSPCRDEHERKCYGCKP